MAKIELHVLGTASMVPTKDRNLTSIFLSYENKGILFDCGEGTQRQMKIVGIKPNKINMIFISHWHGDHVLGLPGLLQTLGNSDYDKTLHIYGPKGTKKYLEYMLKGFIFDTKIDMEINEIEKGMVYENDDFFIETNKLKHSVECLGYSFIEKDKRKMNENKLDELNIKGPNIGKLQKGEIIKINNKIIKPDEVSSLIKGKKITIIFDTEPCTNAIKLSENANLLVCEATYHSDLDEKSLQYKHMTAKNAALLANEANVKKLILTHFSGRYKTTDDIEKEAKDIFPNSVCAYDFMKIKL
ncbi:MAG: ribonuclease Z [Candidatus Woesearchaeota archaeon]